MEQDYYQNDKRQDPEKVHDGVTGVSVAPETGEIVNASGHRDQLQRQYGLLSICGLALTIDNAWVALGGSIAVSISALPIDSMHVWTLTGWQTMVDRLGYCMSCL